ncbi:hypothetical protein MPTK1_7g00380 [Marchantia polymorpha subsp. ruderalis]|uniref:Uncharacterized protein n=2 Tax=Marchantia polymorpha TaxID=3197 RepID=A0AAF6BUQ4_MARPO|nr:hypothetical protein MARPO_0046s0086 [Marchantia polymorpha]BBN15738.1 hypothetical protein Mp_7g00380 [Marchantia polymorpha subsp. ruderalis]|eukprot:PTQ39269.1 hypothetical protein MARPO_0046s0086 [Marchantia polymorpha]
MSILFHVERYFHTLLSFLPPSCALPRSCHLQADNEYVQTHSRHHQFQCGMPCSKYRTSVSMGPPSITTRTCVLPTSTPSRKQTHTLWPNLHQAARTAAKVGDIRISPPRPRPQDTAKLYPQSHLPLLPFSTFPTATSNFFPPILRFLGVS